MPLSSSYCELLLQGPGLSYYRYLPSFRISNFESHMPCNARYSLGFVVRITKFCIHTFLRALVSKLISQGICQRISLAKWAAPCYLYNRGESIVMLKGFLMRSCVWGNVVILSPELLQFWHFREMLHPSQYLPARNEVPAHVLYCTGAFYINCKSFRNEVAEVVAMMNGTQNLGYSGQTDTEAKDVRVKW